MSKEITVPIYVAKVQLSKLIAKALSGETVTICRGKVPVIRFQPVKPSSTGRKFGAYKGRFKFDERVLYPLGQNELERWEG
jgi:antitoxin (DNA-binding transcriptional repressor) of toxin-antitoxin stability system